MVHTIMASTDDPEDFLELFELAAASLFLLAWHSQRCSQVVCSMSQVSAGEYVSYKSNIAPTSINLLRKFWHGPRQANRMHDGIAYVICVALRNISA